MEQKNSQERDRDQKNRAESQGFKSDGVNEKKVLNLEKRKLETKTSSAKNPPFTLGRVHSTFRLVISDAILNEKQKLCYKRLIRLRKSNCLP